jgi:hypothetical protein
MKSKEAQDTLLEEEGAFVMETMTSWRSDARCHGIGINEVCNKEHCLYGSCRVRSMPEEMATDLLARGNQDNRKGEEAMEKRDPFVLDTREIPFVAEAIEARISLLQTLPPSEWCDSRLKFLNSFMKKLDLLMEETQLEQAVGLGMD